ncbi:MAG: very short patch repair endonuclease [Aquidulcibacter sp.]
MANIRGKNTKPEIVVRRLLHKMGYRFRLHRKDLPGTPDIVFPGRKALIFVHGCFWHQHEGCRFAVVPATRRSFWQSKLSGNVSRDRRAVSALKRAGWRVSVIWECQTQRTNVLENRLRRFLDFEKVLR